MLSGVKWRTLRDKLGYGFVVGGNGGRDPFSRVARPVGTVLGNTMMGLPRWFPCVGRLDYRAESPAMGGLHAVVPVHFRRPGGLKPLPRPLPGGDLSLLRQHFNLKDDAQWHLMAGWLIGTLNPHGSCPLLILHGEQGAAKSTATRMLRQVIDPNVSDLRSTPKTVDDLIIAAKNGAVCAFDNFSNIPDWLSDAFCRLATGAGLSKRELYSDAEEVIITAKRPTLINAINTVATRSDLLDRSILVELLPISELKSELRVWSDFERDHPAILGGLLNAASGSLRNLEATTAAATWKPRMLDFFLWATAAESALKWPSGAFRAAYSANRKEATGIALDNSPIWKAIRAFLDARSGYWTGGVGDLLLILDGDREKMATLFTREDRDPAWPKTAKDLAHALKRLTPNMRAEGIQVEMLPRTKAGRSISLKDVALHVPSAA